MKYLLIATGALAFGATAASAEDWDKGHFPYAREHHERCQIAGIRLHDLERDVAMHEGRRHELHEEMDHLMRELDHDCGGWRMR